MTLTHIILIVEDVDPFFPHIRIVKNKKLISSMITTKKMPNIIIIYFKIKFIYFNIIKYIDNIYQTTKYKYKKIIIKLILKTNTTYIGFQVLI